MMRLHFIPGSAAMPPHAALAEADAEYELVPVERDDRGQSAPDSLRLNPWGRVPVLEDGDLVLTESAAIVLHLADRFPAARLAPPVGTRERAELYRWLAYGTNTLQPSFLRWFYPERYTDPAGEAAVKAHEGETLGRHFDWLESELRGREWLVGGERTGADLFLFMLTRWGRTLDPPAWDRPNVRAHFRRLLERPAIRRMLAEQGLDVPDLA